MVRITDVLEGSEPKRDACFYAYVFARLVAAVALVCILMLATNIL